MRRELRTIVSRCVNGLLAPLRLRVTGVYVDAQPEKFFPRTGFKHYPLDETKSGQILQIRLCSARATTHQITSTFMVSEPIIIQVEFALSRETMASIATIIGDNFERFHVSTTSSSMSDGFQKNWPAGTHRIEIEFPAGILNAGRYYLRIGIEGIEHHQYEGLSFNVEGGSQHQPDHGLLAIIPKYSACEYWAPESQ